jgi:hypothetical protein
MNIFTNSSIRLGDCFDIDRSSRSVIHQCRPACESSNTCLSRSSRLHRSPLHRTSRSTSSTDFPLEPSSHLLLITSRRLDIRSNTGQVTSEGQASLRTGQCQDNTWNRRYKLQSLSTLSRELFGHTYLDSPQHLPCPPLTGRSLYSSQCATTSPVECAAQGSQTARVSCPSEVL